MEHITCAERVASQWIRHKKAISEQTVEQLQPNDVLIVFHGTDNDNLARMINGIDATKTIQRKYNDLPRARGLFVTMDRHVAERFTPGVGGGVLEIQTRAKYLHGTEWNGQITRHTHGDDWFKDKFPKSFRPSLSLSLSADTEAVNSEPQAILIGFVNPHDILAVWIDGQRLSRRDAIETLRADDAGFDTTNPHLSLSTYLQAMAIKLGIPKEEVRTILQEEDPETLKYSLTTSGYGPPLTPKAAENIIRQLNSK